MLYRNAMTPPVFSLRNEIDRLFEDTFGTTGGRRGWLPAVDVRESERDYTFELELPGISPEQVDITADNGVLTIRGEKAQRSQTEGEEGRYHFVERSYGSFVRSFQLPQGVEEDGITAEFNNGLLTVRVPKAERPQPRKIQIGSRGMDQNEGRSQSLGSGEAGTSGMTGRVSEGDARSRAASGKRSTSAEQTTDREPAAAR